MNERVQQPAPPGSPTPRPGGLAWSLAAGLLLAAGFGVAEMTWIAASRMEPSVARRVPALLLYAACLYGLYGLGLGLLAHLAARRSDCPRVSALAVGLAGLALVAGVLVAGQQFWESSRSVRLLSLAGSTAGALTLAALVHYLLPERWLPRRVHARLLATLGLATLAIASTAALIGARGEAREPFVEPRGTPVPDAPHIIFVLVDTLRADTLGCYGDPGGLTPNLDAFAARGAIFEHVLAPTSWTLPSVASLFTSRDPWRHGMLDFDKHLPHDVDNLAAALGRGGYDRRAFVSNGLVNQERGFARGFEYFDVYNFDLESHLFLANALTRALRLSDRLGFSGRARNPVLWVDPARFPWLTTRLSFDPDDPMLTDRVLRHVRNRGADPLFLYVHYGAPHSPYIEHPQGLLPSQPEFAPEHRDELWERYRTEVAWTDAAFGRLMAGLFDEGLLDNALIVLTSDHGEEFLEHGEWEHGHNLYEEVVRVPWIVAGPGVEPGTRISERVRLVDIAPTLLHWAGLPQSPDFEGHDQLPALAAGAGTPPEQPAFAELTSRFLNPGSSWFSATQGRWKVIRERGAEGELIVEQLFDLDADPRELAPLETRPPEASHLIEALDAYESLQDTRAGAELNEDQLKAMAAMGYLDNVEPGDQD